MKIEIKSRITDSILFSLETESVKLALEAAVKHGADLLGADLRGAYLQGANLRDADLQGADLRDADLQGAYLQGAYLQGAYLQGAYLQGAYLRGAKLRGAVGIDPNLCTPLRILLHQTGKQRAFKLVTSKGIGPFNGGITYKVGESYEVGDANTDIQEQCGVGINVATLDWCMREWREGYRILIAEYDAPADIAAIPTATDGKFRLHRCAIVGELDLAELGLVVKK